MMASHLQSKYDLSSLKRITYGTEVMPQSTLDRVRAQFPGVDLLQTYGLSEVGVLRSQSREDGSLWVRVGGEGFQTKVVDGDQRPLIEGELKSGDYAYVSVTFYGYDVNGNKGIAAGLNNVMKHSDGPALGGRVSAKVDFDDIDASEDDVDDMDEDL